MNPIIDKTASNSITKFTRLKKNKGPIEKLFDFEENKTN